MPYQSPAPKVSTVKASVMIPPDTLRTIDQACRILGRSRNSWLFGLVLEHLPELAAEADARLTRLRRRNEK